MGHQIRYMFSHARRAIEGLLSANSKSAAFITRRAQTRISQLTRLEVERASQHPADLMNFERKIYSQNGEDGILDAIFERVGVTNRYFVEFGCGDGTENCTRHLLEHAGWRGLWIEGDAANIRVAADRFGMAPVTILERFINRENIVSIFKEAQAPEEPDLLVVDIDGNDYWIWEQLSKHYRPRVLVMEYNPYFGHDGYWIMPYNAEHTWDGSNWYGASLTALANLNQKLGYTLVTCDSFGVNAFFVRNDILNDQFIDSGNVQALYKAPKISRFWLGAPPSVNSVTTPTGNMKALTELAPGEIEFTWATIPRSPLRTHSIFYAAFFVENRSVHLLRSGEAHPVFLSYFWFRDGSVVQEGHRYPLIHELKAHSREWYAIRFIAPEQPGNYTLHITLVQEPLFWFSDRFDGLGLNTTIDVI
jgi:hypothetical protein